MSNKIKIAINAGHYKYTAGRRCLKRLDPNETREWELNARVAEHLERILTTEYDCFEVLRIDDRKGEKLMLLKERTDKANKYKADIYIGIHHNAGINGGKGGGVTVYRYPTVGEYTKRLHKAIYEHIIAENGLKGNRATPLSTADFHECRETAMPAILIENGFMDSVTDVPLIIQDEFSRKTAVGIAKAIAEVCSVLPKPDNTPQPDESTDIEADYISQIENLTDKIDRAYGLINQTAEILKGDENHDV